MIPKTGVVALEPGDRLPDIVAQLTRLAYRALPVVDSNGFFQGIVRLEEVTLASQSVNAMPLIVADDLMCGVTPILINDRLGRAWELFMESGLPALPVVDGCAAMRIAGILKRSTCLRLLDGRRFDAA